MRKRDKESIPRMVKKMTPQELINTVRTRCWYGSERDVLFGQEAEKELLRRLEEPEGHEACISSY